MSKKKRIANRKCSALLAAGAGAAVCLTGGGVHATNGMVSASNTGQSVFAVGSGPLSFFNLFGSKASFVAAQGGVFTSRKTMISTMLGTAVFHRTGTVSLLPWSISVNVSAGLGNQSFFGHAPNGLPTHYFAINFQDTGTKYGWVRVVSNTFAGGINMDLWSYNSAGGNIKTLSNSVTTNRLALTGGKEKLHWSNDNEDGVARYEVQSKDDAGNWTATDSDVPGSGSYSAKVAAGATCRLVVEMTDGSTKEIGF